MCIVAMICFVVHILRTEFAKSEGVPEGAKAPEIDSVDSVFCNLRVDSVEQSLVTVQRPRSVCI